MNHHFNLTKKERRLLRKRYAQPLSWRVVAETGEVWHAASEHHAWQIRTEKKRLPQFANVKIRVESFLFTNLI